MVTHSLIAADSRFCRWLGLVIVAILGQHTVFDNSASAADETPAKSEAVAIEFFEKNVRPILVKHCYECHSGSETNGGLSVDTRAGLVKGGDSGTALVPGEPDKSRLIEAVRYKNPDLQMPPKNPLSPTEVAALEQWVKDGAHDPRQAVSPAALHVAGMSIVEGRDFWSFRPLTKPAVPVVKDAAWIQTPLDTFVLAKLESLGLQPAPKADKRTLIRRVTYDLTGLPPTPDEIAAFMADDSVDAWAKVVERLLKSPDYGVRWGRHWLDVARYADSNGLDENLAFGNAWRYRDYVVNAFNEDKPFDRFVIEQLAGDLLPDADQQTKTATGFLVLGAKVLAEPDREKLMMDTIDEQLDTIGKAFLGMTLGCVRCHDHKFDPLKQTDYYALAAIFKSTKTFDTTSTGAIKHWHEHPFAEPDEIARIKAVDAALAEKKKAASTYKSAAVAKLRSDARAKATEYLIACAGFDPSMPLTQVEQIARPLGLHAHILHHCRLHLEYHPDDPFFSKWHQLAATRDLIAIENHFRPLFAAAETAWAAAKKADPKATKLADPQLEAARAALYDLSGFLAVPTQPEFAFDAETLAEYHRLAEIARLMESGSPDLSSAMGVTDDKVLASLPIHIRGNHRNLGTPVTRGFPEVMRNNDPQPTFPSAQSGRLELAQWLASPRHPLTARVYVNRVWRGHFGAGIVASTENFGKLGDRPTHPELLDWLASYLIDRGWSTKDLHRLILSSSVYQMASTHPQESVGARIDPENHLLWKSRIQRLEAESIRDAILATTGRLDRSIGGKTVPLRNRQFVFDHTSIDHTKYDSLRRAIYLPVIRNNLYTLFEQFDFPDPTMPTGSRNATVVAPQALLLMNADLVMDSADAWSRELIRHPGRDAQRIELAYQRAFGRQPTAIETQRAVAFVTEVAHSSQSAVADEPAGEPSSTRRYVSRQQAWSLLCQSLLASNEFIYVR
ncbi:MAG: PSD1 domain-containing protein [Planctomycetaceae bacterium]|nr:PSD1 domain-containing protein [Planctomycetaceae bacterium]